ncbi:hypothetical protein CDD80_382 [Ophiocordyceps camponoti-rufipedis]|uniref:Acyl-CoA oxidase C-terminal domain-containing protein n=1 Tax=Ophiocordyceps camponoti-rufipedis TaxID=2004952 RepID=A0A2C5ZD50_9HYPO|nr:hypothetical protein CDD80_382 [Ophiocordyceps camponoti-rufipedis]
MSTSQLLQTPLFSVQDYNRLSEAHKIHVSYLRAREIAKLYHLNKSDVLSLSSKFWLLHQDNISAFDNAAISLLTIQLNLAAGTLARYVDSQPEHDLLLDRILRFDVSAQYMLTELHHGLNAKTLETSATCRPDGGFDLHTPRRGAAKYMPPSSPIEGFPCVAVVFAKLIVGSENRGVRPFVVWLNDGHKMEPGITCSLAQYIVFSVWAPRCTSLFTNTKNWQVRSGIAATFKAVLTKATQRNLYHLAERCGAQGLFEHNEIIGSQLEARGISISEGDTLALSIRLASELLLNRYQMPPSEFPDAIIARHEKGLFEESRKLLQELGSGHRSDKFNELILLRCQPLIEAMGHRMAYDAARKAHVAPELLALYEAGIILHDSAWYAEIGGISRRDQFMMESRALNVLLPKLEKLLDSLGVETYCGAPILWEKSLEAFHDQLDTFDERGLVNVFQSTTAAATSKL